MSSGFITEKEVEEAKRIRQEEWDKVRKPEDPEQVKYQIYCLNFTWHSKLNHFLFVGPGANSRHTFAVRSPPRTETKTRSGL